MGFLSHIIQGIGYFATMKKLLYITIATLLVAIFSVSCTKDTQTYADLVSQEEGAIDHFLGKYNIKTTVISDDQITSWTKSILNDSVSPSEYLKLGQWYEVSEGYFKRLCFCINSWGEPYQEAVVDHSTSFYDDKFIRGSYALVRYDSVYRMTDTLDIETEVPVNNFEPYDYELIYNWNESYYASNYYSYSYGSGSNYECTSGGIGFPLRFLWSGGEVSLIVPFSLVSSQYSSYYYTLYYGKVRYTKPTYIPE